MLRAVKRFCGSEGTEAATAVEYAVMLALIIIVCITAITSLGSAVNSTFQGVSNSIPSGGS